jgi:hypothetical protein
MNKPISKPQAAQQRLISHAAVLLEVSANLSHTPQATHVSREKMSPIVAENAELCRIIAASIRTAGGLERD